MAGMDCRSVRFDFRSLAVLGTVIFVACGLTHPVRAAEAAVGSSAQLRRLADLPPVPPPPGERIRVDHTGRREAGTASIYSHSFDGRTMANGRRYDPRASIAASRSLPLGTQARVTNLQTGQSTDVTIADRGPFIAGRVVDLTPRAAEAIGLTWKEGLAPVIVAPIAVPQPDGSLKPGAGAASQQNREAASR